PLAGLIFVLEEVQRDFTPSVFTAGFIASVTSDVVTRLLTGQLPVFHARTYPVPPLVSLPAFLILGIVAGLLGVVFNRSLLGSLNFLAKWPCPSTATAAIIGAGVGLIGWFWPDTVGGGHPLVESTLAGRVALGALPALFLLRFGLTMFSYGSGAPGGLFAPLLVLGALIGLAAGKIGHHYFPAAVDHAEPFAVAGMAVYFSAIVRAPLTAIVLILEMTANYSLMLPLLVGCFAAY